MGEIFRRYFNVLLFSYILLRLLSFIFRNVLWAQEIIAAVLVGLFFYCCIKNISFAWKLLVIELLLGGAGHFFEFQSLLLRTWILGIFAAVWLWHKIRMRTKFVVPPKNILAALAMFGLFFLWAVINGFLREHSPTFVLQDAVLYLFILVLFPALEMEGGWQPLFAAATKIFIFGSALFSVVTFTLYSSGIFFLTDSYYHWFRNVASGKITDLGINFFRIVLPEHILFVPIILFLFSGLMKKISDKKLWALLVCSLIVIILNFTRIYFVALAIGVLFLLHRDTWKEWLRVGSMTLAAALIIFFGFHFTASRGESFGFDLLVGRASGLQAPSTDTSGAIRMAMLPDIFRTIKNKPWFGSGLGTTVTYLDPVTKINQTRTQFDWGYLEMIAELGIVGTIAYLTLLLTIVYNFAGATFAGATFNRGLLAGAITLFVVNITTPALFQGFGVLYFVFLATISLAAVSVKKVAPDPNLV